MAMVAYKIQWDTDGEDVDLPRRVEIPPHITNLEEVSDYLSNLTGFCHKGFMVREVSDEKPRKSHGPRVDRYYDVTCDGCARSRSTDFEKGMERDRDVIRKLAVSEGWRKIGKKTLCPDCVRKKEKT